MTNDQDHRSLGARLDLFHFQEEAPGAAFWHPRGLTLFRLLEERVRACIRAEGYQEVRTPQLFSESLWRRSGHWDKFRENLFVVPDEGRDCAIKPVSCPAHIELARRMASSHRALPLRLAEFGLCHRRERSGALQGLFRLFQFTQDDGHIFCSEAHVEEEVVRFTEGLFAFYRAFGFEDIRVGLSQRPEVRAGSDALWDRAERDLEAAIRRTGRPYELRPGGGAFYGPKLEFDLQDAHGRAWTCGTIQLDFVLPERFELTFVDAGGESRRMVMLHRALLGALERFMAILLEHLGGVLPPWLAPEQVVVAPLSAAQGEGARALCARLEAEGLRPRLDGRHETLARKVYDAQALGIPWFIAFGRREAEGGPLSVRSRDGRSVDLAQEALSAWLAEACRPA
jgi:threonyl-tRNA synthetase